MLGIDAFPAGDRPIVSGAMHYFRTLPEQWPHRLAMLAAMGADCVETYVPWNLHERRRGTFDFDGLADIERFIHDAAAADLAVIVRPGPYICAEWENGGLPAWLRATNPSAPLRCLDPEFLSAVDDWFGVLLPRIAPLQAGRGGPVVAVQVENEYGSYGSDSSYLEWLVDATRRHGIDVPLFTSDGPEDAMLTGGMIDGITATVNFGSRAREAFAALDARRPGEPKWCMEFWNGWFDHWGERHHVRDPLDAAAVLDDILGAGASVNIYMAVGGTNFGTWSGANHDEVFQPTVTSYDYDAPIAEDGSPTEKFHRYREVIGRYRTIEAPLPAPTPRLPETVVELTESLPLTAWVDSMESRTSPVPLAFEQLDIDNGLVWYRHRLRGPRESHPLTVDGLGDRASLWLDGAPLASLQRDGETSVAVCVDRDVDLDVLVESMGRVNYGPFVGERKGMTGVRHRLQTLHGWECTPLPLDDISGLPWGIDVKSTVVDGPLFRRGSFDISEPADSYITLPGAGKGYIWVNGFCLGRHWNMGPQRTYYLPWPSLRPGRNEITILELHPSGGGDVLLSPEPDLGDVASGAR